MSMQAFMSKLKELKVKMAELENMEESMSPADEATADKAEGPIEGVEENLGLDKDAPGEETNEGESPSSDDGKLSDDDVLDLFGKKKKPAPKAGMKIAIAVGKSSPKAMGKYK